jgi:hypothetical protein
MIFTGEKTDFQGFRGHLISHKVIVYFNMLCACMKCKIDSKIGDTNVVTLKHWWSREEDAKILQELKPSNSAAALARARYSAFVLETGYRWLLSRASGKNVRHHYKKKKNGHLKRHAMYGFAWVKR